MFNYLDPYSMEAMEEAGVPSDTQLPPPYTTQPMPQRRPMPDDEPLDPEEEPGSANGSNPQLATNPYEVDEGGEDNTGGPFANTLPATRPSPGPGRLNVKGPDRVSLYQKLQPYKGLGKAERFNRYLEAAFDSAAQPGTGSVARDIFGSVSRGMRAARGVDLEDEARRGVYSSGLMKALGEQEKGEQNWIKTVSEANKRDAEGVRARAYAPYLADRGYGFKRRADAEAQDAATRERNSKKPTMGAYGSVEWDDAQGRYVIKPKGKEDTIRKRTADEAVTMMRQTLGPLFTKEKEAEMIRRIMTNDTSHAPADSWLARSMAIATEKDPAKRAAMTSEFAEAAKLFKMTQKDPKPDKPKPPTRQQAQDRIDAILQPNMAQFTDEDGQVDWNAAIAAARTGKLNKGSDVAVRDLQLAQRLEQLRDSAREKGGLASGGFAPPPAKPAPVKQRVKSDFDSFSIN